MLCDKHEEKQNLSFKDILFDGDNWIRYQEENHPHWYVVESVEKLRVCRTGELGYHFWYCESCGFGGRSPHSCKSKLCSSCATIATKKWLAEVLPTLLNVKYFQIVFTLPPTLYPIFTANKKILYNLFFEVASTTLLIVAASHRFEPGIVAVFHPFGSEYNIHPHIHFMVTAGGLTLNYEGWFPITSWPLEKSKAVFKAILYKKLRKLVDRGKVFNPHGTFEAFDDILQKLYPKEWNLFIEYKDYNDKARYGLSYISRYAKRAIISDHKLVSYDGEYVSFKTSTKKMAKKITVPKDEFIRDVLRHVLPKYFKTTRFYGIYANRKRKKLAPLAKELAGAKGIETPPMPNWRERRKEYSGKDPLLCPRCGNGLTLVEVTYSSRIPDHLQLSIFDHFL